MAKDKDKALNPAAAQRKLEKQKALKKGKAQIAAQRTERFAARNPRRLESQIEDLQALRESQSGSLSARDKKQLEELERDVARIKKARDTLGDKAPLFGRTRDADGDTKNRRNDDRGDGRAGYRGLGKRTRDHERRHESEESEETDEEVRRIPWPKDTPPPIPRPRQQQKPSHGSNANAEPLGSQRFPGRDVNQEDSTQELKPDTRLPSRPPQATRTTYESKPQVRDLRKEATTRFLPQAVKRKVDATKGVGGKLLEEEDLQKLEGQGYGATKAAEDLEKSDHQRTEGAEDELRRLREEEAAFARELNSTGSPKEETFGAQAEPLKRVLVEDVSDEDSYT